MAARRASRPAPGPGPAVVNVKGQQQGPDTFMGLVKKHPWASAGIAGVAGVALIVWWQSSHGKNAQNGAGRLHGFGWHTPRVILEPGGGRRGGGHRRPGGHGGDPGGSGGSGEDAIRSELEQIEDQNNDILQKLADFTASQQTGNNTPPQPATVPPTAAPGSTARTPASSSSSSSSSSGPRPGRAGKRRP